MTVVTGPRPDDRPPPPQVGSSKAAVGVDLATLPPPPAGTARVDLATLPPPPVGATAPAGPSAAGDLARAAAVVAIWLVVAVVCVGLVLFALEPLFQQNHQKGRLDTYRTSIAHSANEAQGLPGIVAPTKPSPLGSSVGILEIPRLRLRQVVIAGAGPAQTQQGPGQVPGTAGPGQPGNTAIVGRRATFGAPFDDLGHLRAGDRILISTTQGQSVYRVRSVRDQTGPVSALSRHTADNRLTLSTSATSTPWNTDRATVVVAALEGRPYAPTPQLRRAGHPTGASGDPAAWLTVVGVMVGYAVAVTAAVVIYRRSSLRVAYLLTAAPLLALSVLAAEALSRLLPAWF